MTTVELIEQVKVQHDTYGGFYVAESALDWLALARQSAEADAALIESLGSRLSDAKARADRTEGALIAQEQLTMDAKARADHLQREVERLWEVIADYLRRWDNPKLTLTTEALRAALDTDAEPLGFDAELPIRRPDAEPPAEHEPLAEDEVCAICGRSGQWGYGPICERCGNNGGWWMRSDANDGFVDLGDFWADCPDCDE